MKITAKTPDEYISKVSDDHRQAIIQLRKTIVHNLPKGFIEDMNYGMIGYVVPHSIYPDGYHSDKNLPLPFLNIASQKNFIALYHMGIYAKQELLNWFVKEFPNHSSQKLDMGKSCIRFRKPESIPFNLIAELVSKLSVDDWIKIYEENYKNRHKKK